MIALESDAALQTLDRRLQIDRVLALEPLGAVPGKDGDADQRGPTTTAPLGAAQQATLATRLPLGRVVMAQVVEVPDARHVVADIERWRVSMAWPQGAGSLLRPGQEITLRVLAHKPMLLFQSVDAAGEPLDADGRTPKDAADAPTRWSPGALELSSRAVSSASRDDDGTIRFTEPIIEIAIVAPRVHHEDREADPATPRTSTPIQDFAATTTDRIGLDDVIVARSATMTDAPSTALPSALMPIVLHGPAWAGQPMELVVRRDRADEELDNPVLDQWCGEIVIDLPLLGRVSGHLAFSMQGLRIRLEGEDATTVATMSDATASLAAALAHADLRVQALSVGQPGMRSPATAPDSSGG